MYWLRVMRGKMPEKGDRVTNKEMEKRILMILSEYRKYQRDSFLYSGGSVQIEHVVAFWRAL